MLTWKDVTEDPVLADLPYKIELAGSGKIVMSPHKAMHSLLQSRIGRHLDHLLPHGEALLECPVDTSDNTKQVDVAWASDEMIAQHGESESWPVAPEICVEVVSPSNSLPELKAKIALYFERGAVECWICKGSGEMLFFTRAGEVPRSELCPRFPSEVKRLSR